MDIILLIKPHNAFVDADVSMATRFKSNYDTRSQLAFDVLAEFGIVTSHVITDIMGEKQAEALVRTSMHHAGLAIALNIKNRMELEGHGLLFVAYAANWVNSIMGMDQKVEMTSIGNRMVVRSCPLSRASGALCCHLVYCPKAFIEVFAPGFISLNPKRLSQGDDTCVNICGEKGVDPDDVLSAPFVCEPLPPPLDLEERTRWNHSYMGNMWTLLLKSILDEIGPEITLNALRPKFNEIGRKFASKFKEAYRVDAEDFSSVAEALSAFHSSFLKKGRFMRSLDIITIITEECPFSGEPPEVCQLFQFFYDGLLEKTNPEFSMLHSEMMSKGDKTCHWLINKKGKPTNEIRNEEIPLDDPARILALRFAKGEINQEEFDRSMTLLRKHNVVN